MDEPFAAVDPVVREGLQDELLRLQEVLAKTILFVTHDIDEAIKLGDVVAVMEAGGRLAQFAPPAEILAEPASDFVARFVGADRGLKRLSLVRVGDLPLTRAVTARPGDDGADARRRVLADPFPHLLLVDPTGRPIGWVDRARIPGAGPLDAGAAVAMSPLFNPRTTAKEALAMLLDAGVQAGIVVDAAGAVTGLLTVDAIVALLRDGADSGAASDADAASDDPGAATGAGRAADRHSRDGASGTGKEETAPP
jgi:osmoprotectant transport system ATP-binding protein